MITREEINQAKKRAEMAEARERAAAARARTRGYQMIPRIINASGSYKGADRSRLRGGAQPRGGSNDYHLDTYTRKRLIAESRALLRNNAVAEIVTEMLIDMVVSDGFMLQAKSPDTEWNRETEAAWKTYSEGECELGGDSLDDVAAGAVRAACTDGDELVVKVDDGGDGALQVIEAERIVNPGGKPDTPTMVGGVIKAGGRVSGYKVAEWNQQGNSLEFKNPTTVLAADAMLLRCPVGLKGTRGQPALANLIERLDRLDKFDEAVAVAAQVQAMLCSFVKTERPADKMAGWPGTESTRASETDQAGASTDRHLDLESGTINFLGPNESIETVQASHPGPNYETYVLTQLAMIGAKMGIPLFALLMDGRQVNLASMRALTQIAFRRYYRWQNWLSRKLYAPVYLFWLSRRIRAGLTPVVEGWEGAFEFIAPVPPVMDALVEINAAKLAVESRLKSRKRVMRELGIDRDTEDEDIEHEIKDGAARGITAVLSPGAKTAGVGGGEPNAEGAEEAGAEGAEKKGAGAPKADAKAPSPTPPGGVKPGQGKTEFLIGDKTLAESLVRGVSGDDIPAASATAILTNMVGLDPTKAGEIIGPAEAFEKPGSEDQPAAPDGDAQEREAEENKKQFHRNAWLGFQRDGTVADVLANQTDLKALTKETGIPMNEEYTDPYLPVRDDRGELVSGETIKDDEGDVVGGAPVGVDEAGSGDGLAQDRDQKQERKDENAGEIPEEPAKP